MVLKEIASQLENSPGYLGGFQYSSSIDLFRDGKLIASVYAVSVTYSDDVPTKNLDQKLADFWEEVEIGDTVVVERVRYGNGGWSSSTEYYVGSPTTRNFSARLNIRPEGPLSLEERLLRFKWMRSYERTQKEIKAANKAKKNLTELCRQASGRNDRLTWHGTV